MSDVGQFILFLIAVLGTIGVLWFGLLAFMYHSRWLTYKKQLDKNLDVDLELATTDQLLAELRNRSKTYLLLIPVSENGNNGISIEVHNMDPVSSCCMLKMASVLTEKELNRRGIDVPDMPPFYGEGTVE